ncbi:MAG: hypothetical protein K6T85_19065 [Gorillibacterium sp.]|nr:hypothetical protein [Gorillibacterium sp.]
MPFKGLNLAELDNQPIDVREAIAFYAAYGLIPMICTAEQRKDHYTILEREGYIQKLKVGEAV